MTRRQLFTVAAAATSMLALPGPATAAPSPGRGARAPRVRSGEWSETGSLAGPRSGHTATRLLDGRVLVVGGFDVSGAGLATAELYDPATGTWRPTGSMVGDRIVHRATLLLSGRVLVTGGRSGGNLERGGNLQQNEIYDPKTGKWHEIHWLRTARFLHTATLLPSGKVLVAGGRGGDSNQAVSTVELYDPETGKWSSLPDMPVPQLHTATLLPGGRVLAAGGGGIEVFSPPEGEEAPPLQPKLCQIFDSQTATWSRTDDLIVGRRPGGSEHTATLLKNGTVLVAGGTLVDADVPPGGRFTVAESETYDPTVGTWTQTVGLLQARTFHTATLLPDSTVLAVGGNEDQAGALDVCERYVPRTRSWIQAGRMVHRRFGHTATLLADGSVLVVGGTTDLPGSPPTRTLTATAELYTLGCRAHRG